MPQTTPESLRYPDSGNLLEDASVLRNAVHFTTGQRAFAASLVLSQPLDHFDARLLAFAAVEAFCAEITATEDVLGWLFALRGWKPGNARECLLHRLDQVQVGRSPYSEEDALKLLDGLDCDSLRHLLHLPTDAQLAAGGFPGDIRERLNRAVDEDLAGLKRVARLRKGDERGRVVAFNKLKHQLVAFHTGTRGRNEVLVPKWCGIAPDGALHLRNVWIEGSPRNVRLMGSRAIIAQAVLNSLLGLILWIRFGEPYENPGWVVAALDLPGWYEERPASEA